VGGGGTGANIRAIINAETNTVEKFQVLPFINFQFVGKIYFFKIKIDDRYNMHSPLFS
jgi:hypothetical protein